MQVPFGMLDKVAALIENQMRAQYRAVLGPVQIGGLVTVTVNPTGMIVIDSDIGPREFVSDSSFLNRNSDARCSEEVFEVADASE